MHLKKRLLWIAGCLLGVLACSAAFAPKLSAAIKSALVEIVLPSKPFFGQTGVTVNDVHFGTGTEEGTLGITNLIVTNFNDVVSTVEIFQPVLSQRTFVHCGGRSPWVLRSQCSRVRQLRSITLATFQSERPALYSS